MALGMCRGSTLMIALAAFCIALFAPLDGSPTSGEAIAQEKKRGNIFRNLFKRRDAPRPSREVGKRSTKKRATKRRAKRKIVVRQRSTKRRSTARRSSNPAARQTARRVVATPNKSEDARVILVIGDFLAAGLARGLRNTYADNPTIVVIDRSMPSSGLVRADHFDWQARAEEFLTTEKRVDLVAVVVGANDGQAFRRPPITFGAEEWSAAYKERATTLMRSIVSAGKPVVWVGVPSMQKSSLSRKIAFLNDVQQQAAGEVPGVTYVDIWDGFADENGRYVSTGPDEKGQVRRLRTSDGINLASAGRSKIAFYAQQEIDKLLGSVSAIAALQVAPGQAGPDAARPVRPDVWEMVLTGESETPGAPVALAGAKPDAPTDLKPREGDVDADIVSKRLRDGLPPTARSGRVDEFTGGVDEALPRL